MNTSRSLRLVQSFVFSAILLSGGFLHAEDADDAALLGRLKERKQSLSGGIAQAEKENGVAISAKFEMDGENLSLSVYTARAGIGSDAEHNVLIELAGDAAKSPWKPEAEVFADKEHLTRSAAQLTLIQLSKLSLVDVIKKVESTQSGIVYSISPAVKSGAPVFVVKVATEAGKSAEVTVNAESGVVGK